jgi:hypothetical protein
MSERRIAPMQSFHHVASFESSAIGFADFALAVAASVT